MAGRHSVSVNARSFSFSVLIAVLSLLALASVFFLSSSSSSRCAHTSNPLFSPLRLSPRNPNPNPPEHSFVASLEKFLTSSPPAGAGTSPSSSDGGAGAKTLDDAIWKRETERLYGDPSDPWSGLSVVRVYVYEMPKKFTYDLLWLFRNTYRETANLTSNGSPVHRLIEQHSIDYWLWADLIAPESERVLKNVIRVHRQEDADLFYIPFFTTISYFLLERQQCKALYRVCAHFSRRL